MNEFSWNYTAKPAWIRDLFYFWAPQQLSILPGKQPAPGGTAGTQQDRPLTPEGRLDFGSGISAVSGRRSCPQRRGWEPWQKALAYAGMGERRKKEKNKKC